MDVKSMVDHQSLIFDRLKKNKEKERLSHAYLFYGEAGVGKKEMAYALACLFYCPNGGCLECDTCRRILSGNHLNVHYIGIEEQKKMISKEQILDLQEEFSKTSLVEGVRIYIVDGIDTASVSAQNSLLKFIEDPLNQTPTIGIFIAQELTNVVSTILSRCTLIAFPSLERKRFKTVLSDTMAQEDACLLSCLTNQQEEAEELLRSEDYLVAKGVFFDFLPIQTAKEAVLFFIKYEKAFRMSVVKMVLKWMIAFYEDLFQSADNEELLFAPFCDKMKLYLKIDFEQLLKQFSLLLELYSKMDYNVSARNIVHELITKRYAG